MPIDKKDFDDGKLHNKVEDEIISFLSERQKRAFTSQEIMEGIHYHTEFNTPEISKMSTFAVADFTAFLQHLVNQGKILMKIVRGRMYFMIQQGVKCPKCGRDIFEAKKTWKMAGRPNKKGERLQLQIGLFECPRDGYFRKAVSKQKIFGIPSKKKKKTEPKKRKTTRKKPKKKKTVRTTRGKRKKKKSKSWILV